MLKKHSMLHKIHLQWLGLVKMHGEALLSVSQMKIILQEIYTKTFFNIFFINVQIST